MSTNISAKMRETRGTEASIPVLLDGQLYLCTDSDKIFKGTSSGNKLISDVNAVASKAENIDNDRTTTSKTVTGSINELNTNKVNKLMSDTWHELPLLAGWSPMDTSESPRVIKDNLGFVHLGGGAWGGTMTDHTVIFTLPVGYRPPFRMFVCLSNQGSSGTLTIYPAIAEIKINGDVSILGVKGNNTLNFDSISFMSV